MIGAPYIFSAKTGKKAYRFAVGGYVRDDDGSVLRLSNAAETAREPHSAIYARFGDEPGAHADIIPAVIASGGDFDLPRDGLIKVNNLQYQLAEGAGVLMDATLIANAVGVAASAAPYTNLRHDFHGAHGGSWTAIIHVGNIVWGGATALEVEIFTTIQQSGAGWMGQGQRNRCARIRSRRWKPPGLRGKQQQRCPQPMDWPGHHLDGRLRSERRHHRRAAPRVGVHHGIRRHHQSNHKCRHV